MIHKWFPLVAMSVSSSLPTSASLELPRSCPEAMALGALWLGLTLLMTLQTQGHDFPLSINLGPSLSEVPLQKDFELWKDSLREGPVDRDSRSRGKEREKNSGAALSGRKRTQGEQVQYTPRRHIFSSPIQKKKVRLQKTHQPLTQDQTPLTREG